MMREFLKGKELDKELIDEIMAEIGKKHAVFEQQIEALSKENEGYKEKIKSYEESSKASEELQKKYDDLVNESKDKDAKLTTSTKERAILKAGITDDDDIEYISFKVGKMEGDFEENLNSFLANNTKFGTKSSINANTKATGMQSNNATVEKESGVSAILKAKHPELFENK